MKPIACLLALVALLMSLPAAALAQPASQQTPAVDAKIEIVWPHDGRGHVDMAGPFVNVGVYLFEHGTLEPVACGFDKKVTLRWAENVGSSGRLIGTLFPAHDLAGEQRSAVGERITWRADGKVFPVWVFNNVPNALRRTDSPIRPDIVSQYFFVETEGVDHRSNVWAHSIDPRTYLRFQGPADRIGDSTLDAADAFIQIVYPHDGAPVTEARLANIGVDLFKHPAVFPNRVSVGFGFDRPVRLLRALNDGYLEPVKTADGVIRATNPVTGASWPRWVFNDVDVSAAGDPRNKYYFAVQVDGVEAHTSIWAHGADARTYFPHVDVPARSGAGCD